MITLGNLDIINVLLCDDVRTEDTGKSIIIGVYNDSVQVNEFPVNLRPVYWLQVDHREVGDFNFLFRGVIRGSETAVISGRVDGSAIRQGVGSIKIGPIPLALEEPADVEFQAQVPDDVWVTLGSMRFELRPT